MPDPIRPLSSAPRRGPLENADNTADIPHTGTLPGAGQMPRIEWLPGEVRWHIGGFLRDRDMLNFASSWRANRETLLPQAAWRRASMLTARAHNLAQLDHAIAAAAACAPRERVTLLCRLARELGRIPSHQAQTAASALLAASEDLSIADQTHVRLAVMHGLDRAAYNFTVRFGKHDQALASLTAELGLWVGTALEGLPIDQQAALLPSYLELVRALPRHQRAVSYWLTRVSTFAPADAMKTLAAAARWMIPGDDAELGRAGIVTLLQFARGLCDRHGGAVPGHLEVLEQLTQCLYALRDKLDPYPLWEALLDAMPALPPGDRQHLWVVLSMMLPVYFESSGARFQAAWLKLADVVDALPANGRADAICILTGRLRETAWAISDPPEQPVSDHAVVQHFHRMLDQAQAFGETERRKVAQNALHALRERFDSLAWIPAVDDTFRPVLERVLASLAEP